MMTPLKLPVALPFEVRTAPLPLFSSEQMLRLQIDLNQPLSDVIESRINTALETLEQFSESGALDLTPQEIPGIEFDGPQPANHTLAWEISAPPMDERTLVVLLNILLELSDVTAFRRINLAPPDYPGMLSPVAVDSTVEHPYPTQQASPPFEFEQDMIYDDASVWIAFESTPSDDAKAEIDTLLTCWKMGMDAGAYRLSADWPQSGMSCEDEDEYETELEADEASEWDEEGLVVQAGQTYLLAGKPSFLEKEMIWDLERCRFHTDAFGTLVNVAMHIHHNIVPISQMNIEG